MKAKRILCFVLAVIFCLITAACNDNAVEKETPETVHTSKTSSKVQTDAQAVIKTESLQGKSTDPSEKSTGVGTTQKSLRTLKTEALSTQELCDKCHDFPPIKGSRYCQNCKCLLCDRVRKARFSYCSRHKCSVSGCDWPRGDSSRYCLEHKCMVSGCSNQSEYDGFYCSSHTCLHVGCSQMREGYSMYCIEHKCIEPGCNSPRSFGSEYYCILHDLD